MFDIDYMKWKQPLYHYGCFEDIFNESLIRDGIHSININNLPMDFLVKNSSNFAESDYVLVCFTAAQDKRKKYSAPFFSGLGISDASNLTAFSFSDSSLAFSKNLALSWYAGNELHNNFPEKIALICDYLVEKFNKKIIFLGGSGGGFASLNIQQRMRYKNNTISIVFNPQTDLMNYGHTQVAKYMHYSYPSKQKVNNFLLDSGNFDKSKIHELGGFLDCNIKHKLIRDENCKVIMLMDGFDHPHIRLHVKPYLKNQILIKRIKEIFYFKNMYLLIGDWGSGHTAVPQKYLVKLLCFIKNNGFGNVDFFLQNFKEDVVTNNRKFFIVNEINDYFFERLKFELTHVDCMLIVKTNVYELFFGYQLYYTIFDKVLNKVVFKNNYMRPNYFSSIVFDIPVDRKPSDFIVNLHLEDWYGDIKILSHDIALERPILPLKCKFRSV